MGLEDESFVTLKSRLFPPDGGLKFIGRVMITQGCRCCAGKRVKICVHHLSKVDAVELQIEEEI